MEKIKGLWEQMPDSMQYLLSLLVFASMMIFIMLLTPTVALYIQPVFGSFAPYAASFLSVFVAGALVAIAIAILLFVSVIAFMLYFVVFILLRRMKRSRMHTKNARA